MKNILRIGGRMVDDIEAPFKDKCKFIGSSTFLGGRKRHHIDCITENDAVEFRKVLSRELPTNVRIFQKANFVTVEFDDVVVREYGMNYRDFDLALWGSLNSYINSNYYGVVLPKRGD